MRRTALSTTLVILGLLSAACGTKPSPTPVAAAQVVPITSPTTVPEPTTTVPVAPSITTTTTAKPAAATTIPAPATTVRAAPTTVVSDMANYQRDFGRIYDGPAPILINDTFATIQGRFAFIGTSPPPSNLDGTWQAVATRDVWVAVVGGRVAAIVSVQDSSSQGGQVNVPGFHYGMSLTELQVANPTEGLVLDLFDGQGALRKDLPNGAFYAVSGGCTTGGIDTVVIVATGGFKSLAEGLLQLGNCWAARD